MRWTAVPVAALLLIGACQDPVRPAPVAEVTITPEVSSLEVGDTLRLAAVARDEFGAPIEGARVVWSTDNASIATVTDGLLRALAPGRVVVSAETDGTVGRAEIQVEIPVHSIRFEPDRTVLGAGAVQPVLVPWSDPATLAAAPFLMVLRNEAGQILPERRVRFTSRDTTVVRVTPAGELRAVGPGTTVVTAQAGAATGELDVRVAGAYTLRNLGTLGGRDSRAYGINAAGQVVGEACTPERCSVPFLWSAGTMTALSAAFGSARAVADDGTVVGNSGSMAYRWRDGEATPLFRGTAYAIDDRGTVVGGWVQELCTRNCAIGGNLYRDGAVEPLPLYATGISADGEVAGHQHRAMTLELMAVRYRDGVVREILPGYAGSRINSEAYGVNRAGHAVGSSAAAGGWNASLWTATQEVQLGLLRGFDVGRAYAVNDRGQVVGANADFAWSRRRAFLWDDGFLADLNRLVDTGGLILEEARGINEPGWIVGIARDPATGATTGFLLVPSGT
jgi:probable HAF family extracellular repeat protein